MKRLPEINCDLGEGIANEADIFPWIDTASVACGGHFGDRNSILQTLLLAKKNDKKIGAHPSYPDKVNFGRKSMKISLENLLASIQEQINLFLEVSSELGLEIDHIKMHGALYNDAAASSDLADSLTTFYKKEYPGILIFVPPNSQMERFAQVKNMPTRKEVFADRAYQNDFSLVSRSVSGSLLTNEISISKHLQSILEQDYIQAITGEKLAIKADTLCFHGDNPGLLEFLPKIRKHWWK